MVRRRDAVPAPIGRLIFGRGGVQSLDDAEFRHAFAQEVRPCTPFVPALAGRVRGEAELDGCPAQRGDRIVLDVPAVDHDEHTYTDPGRFRPERFDGWEPDAHHLVPQGGGDVGPRARAPGPAGPGRSRMAAAA